MINEKKPEEAVADSWGLVESSTIRWFRMAQQGWPRFSAR
jgi:hypothetical protein